MIARIWNGMVPISKSSEYLRLMRTVAIPDYKSVPGNRGAFALHRVEGENAHFIMLTFWESAKQSHNSREKTSTWRNTTISTPIFCWRLNHSWSTFNCMRSDDATS
jgi:heme-degrading monooxygenase HmoA